MFISTSRGNQNYKPVEVEYMDELTKLITKGNYSLSTFKDNDRTVASFLRADSIGLDFDDGLSLDDAVDVFKDYMHIIATTKSHQIQKNGVVADRFRVILFLDEPITDANDFKATMVKLMADHPSADPACKDASRMFYPSTKIITSSKKGKKYPVVKWVEPPPKPEVELVEGERGTLLKATLEFLQFGAKPGTANDALYRAAKDMQQNGYTKDEVISKVETMISIGGTWASSDCNEKDLQTIDSAFSKDANDQPRVEQSPFNFVPLGELFKTKNTMTWAVDKLLQDGGMSVIVGPPKSGKSTLVRQLARAICRGETFLGRTCHKGGVVYLALEEHAGLLREQFKTIGMTRNDPMMIHVGHLMSTDAIGPLSDYVSEVKPKLVIIDTLSLFGNFENMNDYESVNKIMHAIKKIARDTGVHVTLIHHTNKSETVTSRSVMGSQAIFGSVDNMILFNQVGTKRFVTSQGRGTVNLDNTEIVFNPKTELYTIGASKGGSF